MNSAALDGFNPGNLWGDDFVDCQQPLKMFPCSLLYSSCISVFSELPQIDVFWNTLKSFMEGT